MKQKIFINKFYSKNLKRLTCNDFTRHDLLDTNSMHLFTPNFNILSVLPATKTDFPLSLKKNKKLGKMIESIYSFLNNEIIFIKKDT